MTRSIWLLLLVAISLCAGLSGKEKELRDATVISDGTATDQTGHRFETVTVVILDDSGQTWKRLVLNKTAFQGKSAMGPVGSHFQCNILESFVRGGQLEMLMVQSVESKGRKKLIPFIVVEELGQ